MSVTAEAESVLREAMAPSSEDRASVAAELLASLDPADDTEEVEEAWGAEIERRIDRAESEGFQSEDLAVIRERLIDRFTR